MAIKVSGSRGSRQENHHDMLHVAFDGGVTVDVDLAQLRLSEKQRYAVDKLIDRAGRINDAQCRDGRCPAQDFLEPDDFATVRELNASLGTMATNGEVFAWIIIDFCIHPLVHHVESPEETRTLLS
jgi:hypothetical protein